MSLQIRVQVPSAHSFMPIRRYADGYTMPDTRHLPAALSKWLGLFFLGAWFNYSALCSSRAGPLSLKSPQGHNPTIHYPSPRGANKVHYLPHLHPEPRLKKRPFLRSAFVYLKMKTPRFSTEISVFRRKKSAEISDHIGYRSAEIKPAVLF